MSEHVGDQTGEQAAVPIRILIADDETLFRDALATLLDLRDDLHVVAQAASGPEAVAMARAHRPDVALLDLQMPGQDGIETAIALAREAPEVACLIVTSHGRPGYLRRALEAGVRGFLPKTASRRAWRRRCTPPIAANATSIRNWRPMPLPPGPAPCPPGRPTCSN